MWKEAFVDQFLGYVCVVLFAWRMLGNVRYILSVLHRNLKPELPEFDADVISLNHDGSEDVLDMIECLVVLKLFWTLVYT